MTPPRHRIESHVQYLEGDCQLQAFQVIRNVCGLFEKPAGQPFMKMCYFHHPVGVDVDGDWVKVPPHTVVFYPANAYQRYGDRDSRWDHVWWLLGGAMARDLMEASGVPWHTPITLPDGGAIERLVSGLNEELSRTAGVDGEIVRCLLTEFLRRVARVSKAGTGAARIPVAAARIRSWLDRRFRNHLNLKAVADAHHMSVPNLCLVFRRAWGIPVGEYILHRRLEQAKLLLGEPDLPIREVAAACGYQDPYYFSRLFSKRMGSSPLNWRRLRQKHLEVGRLTGPRPADGVG